VGYWSATTTILSSDVMARVKRYQQDSASRSTVGYMSEQLQEYDDSSTFMDTFRHNQPLDIQ
jgi:hypothetical protein